jgi:hypothetical protein
MNTTQALTKLRKLIGPKAAIQDHKRPSSPELREQHAAARLVASERKRACDQAMTARFSVWTML